MQLPPASIVFSWPAPNYIDPQDVRGPGVLKWIFYILAVITVGARVFTCLRISRNFGIEDILLLPAVVSAGGCALLTTVANSQWGWNRHIWDVSRLMLVQGLKMTILLECLFGISITLTKVSLLLWTRKITTNGILQGIAIAGVVAVVCEGFVFNLLVVFACRPVSAYWTLSTTSQQCIDERTHLLIGGIVYTCTDFFVLALPLLAAAPLKISRRQKLLICLLAAIGFAACLAGIAKIWLTWAATSTYDQTWASYGRWISSLLELDMLIICTALVASAPFMSRFFPTLMGSSATENQVHHYPIPISHAMHAPPDFSHDKSAFFDSLTSPFKLVSSPIPVPIGVFKLTPSRIDSRHMLPLSCLESPKSGTPDRQSTIDRRSASDRQSKRSSNRTSISTFITARGRYEERESAPSMSTFDFEAAGFLRGEVREEEIGSMYRGHGLRESESREGLFRNAV